MDYSELHCFSNFSFLRGASHPEELVQQAAALGYGALAITDECSVAGVVRAHVATRAHPIKLIVGADMVTEEQLHLVVLAPTREAYGQLCTLITRARSRSEKGHYQLRVKDLYPATDACLFIWLPTAGQCLQPNEYCQALLAATAERLWIGLENNLRQADADLCRQRQWLAQQLGRPVVACGNVHCHVPQRQPLQDIVTAIRLNTHVQSAGFQLHANRETSLRPVPELAQYFPAEALRQTQVISQRCTFSLTELRYEYPREVVPPGHSAQSWLRQLVAAGAQQRWPAGVPEKVQQQLDKELTLIHELAYEYYFLTSHVP